MAVLIAGKGAVCKHVNKIAADMAHQGPRSILAGVQGGSASPDEDGMGESPKAQISGGKAASLANALRTTRSTFALIPPGRRRRRRDVRYD